MPGIFLIQGDGSLVEMTESRYDSESLLQTLLAQYPSLMAGDQMDSGVPRKWLLIRREMPVPAEEDGYGRWSLDHLFLDQDAIPTLIEVKRSTDTRIRREVVGQMLDYAANAVAYWPVEEFRSHFERECEACGKSAEEQLRNFLGLDASAEEFWQKAKTNLQAGRIRMVFVADVIPRELRRIVEFLNEQMDPAEVLAVEIKQYVGQGMQTLVPRVIGQTAEAEKKKGRPREERQWDEVSFFSELERRNGREVATVARRLYEHFRPLASHIWWGRGRNDGNLIPRFDDERGKQFLIGISTGGTIDIEFAWMNRLPFSDLNLRREFQQLLNAVPGVSLPDDCIERFPKIEMLLLCDESAFIQFRDAVGWAARKIIESRIQ